MPEPVPAINGLPTQVAAFIGSSVAGPFYQATRLFAFTQFAQRFGGATAKHELAYAVHLFFLNGGKEAWTLRIPARAARKDWRQALGALDEIDSFNLLVLPGLTAPGIINDAIAYCEKRRAFLILDAPRDAATPAQIRAWAGRTAFPRSPNAAAYYPWIKVATSSNGGAVRLSAPSGAVAGVYARTDTQRGVWKAPAGQEALIAGIVSLAQPVSDSDSAQLNSLAINCLRSFSNGDVVWGARTLAGRDDAASDFKYVPVRRTALFLEASIDRGTQWATFEPNGEPLWARLRLQIGRFLDGLWRQGAFQGVTPKDAWFVRCDRTTTTQNDVDNGRVNIEFGFAPLRPTEFVVIKLQKRAGRIRK
jgi:uncharacterized protein